MDFVICTSDQGSFHAGNAGVYVVDISISLYVFEQQSRIRQALNDRVHETSVSDVFEAVQSQISDRTGSVVKSIVVAIASVAFQRISVGNIVRSGRTCRSGSILRNSSVQARRRRYILKKQNNN